MIDNLRPSTKYEVCLWCFYEETDQSFKEKICHTTGTKGILYCRYLINLFYILDEDKYSIWIVGTIVMFVVIVVPIVYVLQYW